MSAIENSSDTDSARARLVAITRNPASLHPTLGRAGFSIPDIASYTLEPIRGGAGDNWIAYTGDPGDLARARRFHMGPSAKGNLFIFGESSKVFGNYHCFGSGNSAIMLGDRKANCPISLVLATDDHIAFVGEGTSSNTTTLEFSGAGTAILIGEDCMFSAGIHVHTHDHHAIIDLETGLAINDPADVVIEPHAWIGLGATILKGVRIGFGAVVGTSAVVTKDVPRRTAVAGVPARVVRRSVSWTRARHADPGARAWLAALARRYQCENDA